jgi:hypothetical protein
MKRSVVLAIGALALTAIADPLFAAETEMAAPRAAPSARRAQPQRAAPQRQAPQQQASQTNSFTGAQAGGFGGGNAGGGGFADPICETRSGGLNIGCTAPSFNHGLNNTAGVFGGVAQFLVPVAYTPWGQLVAGIMGDFGGGKATSTSTQSFTYADSFSCLGCQTTANYTNSVSQGTSGSARLKAGIVMPVAGWYTSIMPYVTVGWVRTRFDGTFNYASSSYAPGCTPFTVCSTNAAGGLSWSQSANGVIYGIGVDIPVPAIGPGVVIALDYSRADFQSFSVAAPIAIVTPGCIPGPTLACTASDKLNVNHASSNKFTVQARFKFM